MQRKFIIHPKYKSVETEVQKTIVHFDDYHEILGDAERNVIKIVEIEGKKYTIKSFKVPNFINQVVYRFFRKSKAERSYNYANRLLELGIKTPFPLAYDLYTTFFLFRKSYYVSELLNYDLTYRELVHEPDYPDHEAILRAFTRFTYDLHEKGILFLDHSPGNTLIVKTSSGYDFYLVDLNRMEFRDLDIETRIRNFSRLTPKKEMVAIMSNEYAKLTGEDESMLYQNMWGLTEAFQKKYHDKIALKRKIFFWKKKYRED
ncbi:lipopolysaccharide kinase InaA family protein [Aquimarina megaterium]|uniref:lipopolysaccharide kinase InaA family protein n=1 Tax=Aquimarina megaterium TaxID=1443666 RepID=UPI00046EBED5|nr:lipopolysaccharide kinase InaA family protein [Aquimarina megaterium]